MMIRSLVAPAIGAFALSFACVGMASAQELIGIQFVGGGGPGTTKALAATDKAGVPAVAQTNWNAMQGTNGTNTALNTDDGKSSGATVSYKCPNTWSSGLDASTPDLALMGGYIDTQDTADDSSIDSVTVSGITFATYDVYVYVYGDSPGEHRQGIYKIGANTQKVTDFGSFTGTYKAPTSADPTGNYVEFKGITGSSFTLTGAPGDTDGTARAPINAVQIVKE